MYRILLGWMLLLVVAAHPAHATVRKVSELQDAASTPRLNDAGQVGWLANGVAYLWDGSAVRALGAATTVWPGSLQVSQAGHVAWLAPQGDANEIDLWDGNGMRPITAGWPLAQPYGWSLGKSGHLAWVGQGNGVGQIFFWDGVTVRRLSSDSQNVLSTVQVNERGHVVWQAIEGGRGYVYLWDGVSVRRLGAGRALLTYPWLNPLGQVIWDELAAGYTRIFLRDSTAERQITEEEISDMIPRMNGAGQAVWLRGDLRPWGDRQVIYWDGTGAVPLTGMGEAGSAAEISEAGSVVWAGKDLLSLWLWDGTSTRPLAQGLSAPLAVPFWMMSDRGHVAWRDSDTAAGEIYLWNGTEVLRLTDNATPEGAPAVNNRGQVAWAATDGIYLYTPSGQDGSDPPPAPVPVGLDSIEPPPAAVLGGSRARLRLRLTGEAPSGGLTLTLASSDAAVARVPESVTIPAGERETEFWADTSPVAASTALNVTATLGDTIRVAELHVTRVSFSDLGISPAPVTGGNTATAVVRILETPGEEGLWVSLASDNPTVASVPPRVLLSADTLGGGSASFPIATRSVRQLTPVRITAASGPALRTVSLLVSPVGLARLIVAPARLQAGKTAKGIVTLTGRAPAGGVVVALQADPPAVAPATVKVPARLASFTFRVTVPKQARPASLALRATYGGASRATTLQVKAR
jgi:hypothetical protein